MTFLKFCAFVMALGCLKSLTFGIGETPDLDKYQIIGRLIGYFIAMYLTYSLLKYSGPDAIEFFKILILEVK